MKPSAQSLKAVPTDSRYTIEALQRGLQVLSLFSREAPVLSLKEIVDSTGLNKSTAYRIVSTLSESGYLERNSRTKEYRPGLKVLQLGFTAIISLDVRQVAHPYLRQLSAETGETASLSVLDEMEVVYLDRVRNRQIVGVVLGLGSRIPANCASMGKVMLAHLPLAELERRLFKNELSPCTGHSHAEPDSLKRDLLKVQADGYATNDEELEIGLRAVAAPVWDHTGQVIAAINVSGSVRTISRERLTDELAPSVTTTAALISQALGHSGSR
jgi:PcaR/PcaU/PobR family beta-ketoadipate pathway transcriptional regulator